MTVWHLFLPSEARRRQCATSWANSGKPGRTTARAMGFVRICASFARTCPRMERSSHNSKSCWKSKSRAAGQLHTISALRNLHYNGCRRGSDSWTLDGYLVSFMIRVGRRCSGKLRSFFSTRDCSQLIPSRVTAHSFCREQLCLVVVDADLSGAISSPYGPLQPGARAGWLRLRQASVI